MRRVEGSTRPALATVVVRQWREGEAFVFDDTVEHEAWNRTTDDRTVLLFDFSRPGRENEMPAAVASRLRPPKQ